MSAPSSWEGKTYHRSVSDPTRYAGDVFAMQLAAVGIEVAGPIRLGPMPEAATVLHEFEGQPLAEVVRRFDEDGATVGEARMLGLFTSKAYMEPAANTPVLRRKLEEILRSEDTIEGTHDHKAMVDVSPRTDVNPRKIWVPR